MVGFIIGSFVAQFLAAYAYWKVRGSGGSPPTRPEWLAVVADGVAYVLVASPIYIAGGVQHWLLGAEASWGVSVFMAVCMALVHAVLFRGRPSLRRPPTPPKDFWPPPMEEG